MAWQNFKFCAIFAHKCKPEVEMPFIYALIATHSSLIHGSETSPSVSRLATRWGLMGHTDWSLRFLWNRGAVCTRLLSVVHITVTWRLDRHLEGTASPLNRADWTHLCDPRCPSLSSCVCDYTFYNLSQQSKPKCIAIRFLHLSDLL